MWWSDYWPMPGMFFGPVLMFLFVIACMAMMFFMMRGGMMHRHRPPDAIDILKERYARGEITRLNTESAGDCWRREHPRVPRLQGRGTCSARRIVGEHPMDQRRDTRQIYVCPMHTDVRQPNPGKCPRCGMALQLEGTQFGMLRHMVSSPLHLVIMVAAMVAVMAAAMMMLLR